MPINAICSECGRTYHLADRYAGKAIKCKGCGKAVRVPAAATNPIPSPFTKKKNAWPLIIAGGVVVVLLVGLVGGGGLAVVVLTLINKPAAVAETKPATPPNTQPAVAQNPPARKVSPDTFAKLQKGMDEKEVVALLGPPVEGTPVKQGASKWIVSTPLTIGEKRSVWLGDDNYEYLAIYFQGKLIIAYGTNGIKEFAPVRIDDGLTTRADMIREIDAKVREELLRRQALAGPKPAVKPTVFENFAKLRPGMSFDQVVDLVGTPIRHNDIRAKDLGGVKFPACAFYFWGQVRGEHFSVMLQENKLIAASGVINNEMQLLSREDGTPRRLTEPPTRTTKTNFAKILRGMTEKEVLDLLGPPSDNEGKNSMMAPFMADVPNASKKTWHGSEDFEALAAFQDGKLIRAFCRDGQKNPDYPSINAPNHPTAMLIKEVPAFW